MFDKRAVGKATESVKNADDIDVCKMPDILFMHH